MQHSLTALVVIGRNEAENLEVGLPRIQDSWAARIYVDSASNDNSVDVARANSFEIVELDRSKSMSAARARNAGFKQAITSYPAVEFVQFVDGDCELVAGFAEKALSFFAANTDVGIVVGRNRERFPDRSVYNAICDVEWNTAVGEIDGCGGIFMIRTKAFEAAGGFNPDIIAAEDTELCLRVREAGFRIHRIDAEMSLHDANMTRFSQWWTRSLRAGHAFADCRHRYREKPEQMFVADSNRSWLFGIYMLACIASGVLLDWRFALGLGFFPLQAVRIQRSLPARIPDSQRWPYAWSCVGAYLPQLFGQLKFHANRLRGVQSRIIEHK